MEKKILMFCCVEHLSASFIAALWQINLIVKIREDSFSDYIQKSAVRV